MLLLGSHLLMILLIMVGHLQKVIALSGVSGGQLAEVVGVLGRLRESGSGIVVLGL